MWCCAKIPCLGFHTGCGVVAPWPLGAAALSSVARFNDLLFAASKKNKSEAGLAVSFRQDSGEVNANFSLSGERIERLPKMEKDLREAGAAAVDSLQKLEG